MEILEESGVNSPEQEDSTKIEADFDENCYLAAQAYYFVNSHFRNKSGAGRIPPTPYRTVFMAHNFTGRDTNELNPSIPSKLMNRLDLTDFVYAEPKLFSLLYPKIELYRVDYISKDGNNTEVDRLFLIPQETNSKYSVYNDVLNKKIAGAGVKSINWTIAGSNPAAAEKLVDLEINFEFSNALELGGGELNNILDHYIKGEPFPFSETDTDYTTNNFLSLILFPQGKRDEYNGKFYRLKAKLGWQYVTEDMLTKIGYSEDKAKKLAIALSKQSIVMMLNLISHSFDITEEGSVSLQTKYQASFEQAADSGVFDIFYRHNVEKEKLKDNPTLKLAQSSVQSVNVLLDSNCVVISNEEKEVLRKTSLQTAREGLEKVQEQQRADLKQFEIEAKNSFMSLFRKSQNSFYYYNFEVTSRDIINYENYLTDINNGVRDPVLIEPLLTSTTIFSGLTIDDGSDLDQGTLEVEAQSGTITSKLIQVVAGAGAGGLEGISKAGEYFSVNPSKFGENVWVSFLYLYDILNILYITLELNIKNAHPNETLKQEELLKELLKYKIVLGDYKTATGKIINLGELPISFSVFHEWYMNNIAKTDVTNYTLQSFVYSLFNDIVAKSLGASCVSGAKLDNKVSIGFVTYSLEHRVNLEPLDTIDNLVQGGYIDFSAPLTYRSYTSCLVAPDDLSTPKQTTNYLYVYSKQLGCELTGEINNDLQNGIYHFYIGQAEGIHKSIKFKRIDQPYLKEARATKEDSFVLGQLREVYNVDLTTVGNTVFYPGMVIYIHPPIEFGATTEKNNFAYLMGIGGYYSVIKVQSVIDQDKFETSLECVYLSSGVCEEKDLCDIKDNNDKISTEAVIARLEVLNNISKEITKLDSYLGLAKDTKTEVEYARLEAIAKGTATQLVSSYSKILDELNKQANLGIRTTVPVVVNLEVGKKIDLVALERDENGRAIPSALQYESVLIEEQLITYRRILEEERKKGE